MITRKLLLAQLLVALVGVCRSLTTPSSLHTPRRVVVIGKIIVDVYGQPSEDGTSSTDAAPASSESLTIGGGGPQAAWGAAAALAARSYTSSSSSLPPPLQPVTFLGPVGSDWTSIEEEALLSAIGPALDAPPVLVKSDRFRKTPRIRLWHDEEQRIQWYALDDSFGVDGADGLWAECPSVTQVLSAMGEEENVVLHSILEGGAERTGRGGDAVPLLDPVIRSRAAFVGVEPVVFPDETTGFVSAVDAAACASLFEEVAFSSRDEESPPRMICSPDRLLYESLPPDFFVDCTGRVDSFAIRDGPNGSIVTNLGHVPASKLRTENGEPVNPTGAGNAYASAYTACRGTGSNELEAACLATAVGAVVCEWEHLPPWTSDVIVRIRDAALEVEGKVTARLEEMGARGTKTVPR